MPERIYSSYADTPVAPNWGGIWAGTFAFLSIWFVFGMLGEAIFGSITHAGAAAGGTGMGVGMAIWTVILTIIAMFVAGRTTGRLAGVTGYTDALVQGIAMFGLSMTAVLIIAGVGEIALGGLVRTSAAVDVLHLFAGLGWVGFVSLFLGWLAALGGACTTVHDRVVEAPADQVRRAAA